MWAAAAETARDLATLNKRVHQIMSRNPVTLRPDSSVSEAARLILEHGISCIPVVNGAGKPVGIVSWRDLLKSLSMASLGPNRRFALNAAEDLYTATAPVWPRFRPGRASPRLEQGALGIQQYEKIDAALPYWISANCAARREACACSITLASRVSCVLYPTQASSKSSRAASTVFAIPRESAVGLCIGGAQPRVHRSEIEGRPADDGIDQPGAARRPCPTARCRPTGTPRIR